MPTFAKTLVAFNSFVRRQTPESHFSHWDFSDEIMLERIEQNWKFRVRGYREGVYLVPIDPSDVWSSLVTLQAGDQLLGEFSPRQSGEEPRKYFYMIGQKQPAQRCDVVLYSHDTLAEDSGAETDAQYEIVSVNAGPTTEEMPIDPDVLMANHFKIDGGTATNMTPERFESQMRQSFLYWKDKIFVRP